MSEWQKSRKSYIVTEILCIVACVVCVVVGIVCDICVSKGIVWHWVESLNEYSMVLLQIQASVGTLTIAIIALISGNITDSYMGVSISDYFLNIRPVILKQKVIIFISLILVLVNSICHMFSLYNLVIFMFVISFILVGNSIAEIYSIFAGRRKMQDEIEKYYYDVIEGKNSYEQKLELLKAFVDDWKNCSTRQNEADFNKYNKFLTDGLNALMKFEENKCIIDSDELCYEVAINLLLGVSENEKEHGIVFVKEIYEFWWKYILREKNGIHKYNQRVLLFGKILYEFVDAIEILPAEKVEKIISIDYLLDNVIRVAYWVGYNETDSKLEIGYVNCFARYVGVYLSKQHNRGNFVNEKYWGRPLRNLFNISYSSIPENLKTEYQISKCLLQFDYCYGLLLNGKSNIVMENMYYHNISNAYKIEDKQSVMLVLSLHCFLFYLYSESENCVSSDIRKQAENILKDNQVKRIFSYFLYHLSENIEWLDEELEEKITLILERHELFPKYENAKTMISDSVVRDFYLFIVLYLSEEYYIPELPKQALKAENYSQYVYDGSVENTKTKLRMLYYMTIQEDESESFEGKIDMMFDALEKSIKQKYKEREISHAAEAQKAYEEEVDVRELCAKIKSNTIERFKKKFGSVLVDEINDVEPIKIGIFELHNYTEDTKEGIRQNFYSDMFGNFFRNLVSHLSKQNVVEIKNRWNDFSDDREFMKYLEENQLKWLFGSKFALSNRDYKLKDEFNAFIEHYNCIYTGLTRNGLAIKENSIKIYLHDVNVSIRPAKISDENVKYDNELKTYKYSIYSGMQLEFDKKELKEYLYNMRKIIEISIVVSIQIEGESIGAIITTNKE